MSASAAASPATRKDQHLELILEMGGSREEGYDPIPPAQYLCFLDSSLQLSPRGHQLLALIRWGCLRLRPGGRRSPFAVDERGRPLRKKDCARLLGETWDLPAISRIWKELETAELVREKDDKLWLRGDVPQKRTVGEDATGRKRKAPTVPRYVLEQIRQLPEDEARRAERAFFLVQEVQNDLNADAIYLAREKGEAYAGEVMAAFGVKLRRHEQDEEEAKKRRAPLVEVSARLSVQDFFKRLEETPVQPIESTLYSAENESVRDANLNSSETEEYRVSSGAPEAPAGFSCEDSLTPQDEEEAQEDGAPGATETAPAKTFPVEGERTRPTKEESPAVAFVQKFWNKPLSEQLRKEFENLGPKFGISQMAVARFLLDKMEEKIRASYLVEGPPALLTFANSDLPGWIKQNRAYVARTAATQDSAAAEPETQETPAEKCAALERLAADMPTHLQAEEWRRQAAELRAQLGDQAPPVYVPETPEEELARLEAQAAEFTGDDRGSRTSRSFINGKIRQVKEALTAELAAALDYIATNPEDSEKLDQTRARVLTLKSILSTKTNSAGS